MTGDLDYLKGQFAEFLDEHPPEVWSSELVRALIAVIDLHAESNSHTATVAAPVVQLDLVRAGRNR